MDKTRLRLWPKVLSHLNSPPEDIKSALQDFAESLPSALERPELEDEDAQKHFVTALAGSQFFRDQVLNRPQMVPGFFKQAAYLKSKAHAKECIQAELQALLSNATDLESFNQTLRIFRNGFLAHIIFQDFNRLISMQQTTLALSLLAEVCLQACLEFHYQERCKRDGTPRNSGGEAQPLLVLGMGKLGAWELNLSSDIDLIFTYPEAGETDHPTRAISNQEFFSRLGKAIIQSLDATTADGFVFRVDMRLRPWGSSGALVSHFDALENYYQSQGREWERYAMIKARVVASNGKNAYTHTLVSILQNFTFRRYIDFSVIEALRHLKKTINEEVKRKKLFDDIKRGNGGIREVEFIVQVFQLIRGGKDHELRDNRLLNILPKLVNLGCMNSVTAEALEKAYIFLRNTEHALQGYKDQQTQRLPKDESARYSLALVMGFPTWEDFYSQLSLHRETVSKEFQAVIAPPESEEKSPDIWQQTWLAAPKSDLKPLLANHFDDPEKTIALIEDLKSCHAIKSMQPQSQQRLAEFAPKLLAKVVQTQHPTETLKRILPLVKAVARRSAYLLLLIENPSALQQLVTLAAVSPWIADQLAKHPALLDELLDARRLYQSRAKPALQQELHNHMKHLEVEDLEAQMEHLRYFRSAHALQIAAGEIAGTTPLMKVSDYLTFLAETLIEYALALTWREMTAKYGYPDGDEQEMPNFIVVGYGKVGGIELGHSSDLDLVFIHNASMNGETDGERRGLRSLDNHTFYTRLGQKLIHILNTKTVSGQLYEVDMRLRPSGNSGLLVTTLSGFEKYQRENAWTWEHQALVRARPLAGNPALCEKFNATRQTILKTERPLPKLRKEVVEMREKMRAHLGNDKTGDGSKDFHLKQDSGGIVDIEFMVQYMVLAWSHNEPGLAQFTDNIRILESLEQSNMLSSQEVEQLIEAYKAFRSIGHRLALQKQPNLVNGSSLNSEREIVMSIWQKLLIQPLSGKHSETLSDTNSVISN